jgi:hypothetical protein
MNEQTALESPEISQKELYQIANALGARVKPETIGPRTVEAWEQLHQAHREDVALQQLAEALKCQPKEIAEDTLQLYMNEATRLGWMQIFVAGEDGEFTPEQSDGIQEEAAKVRAAVLASHQASQA